jgi:serine/threonine protein kinase
MDLAIPGYRLVALLGQGAFAHTALVQGEDDLSLGVAKRLVPRFAGDPEAQERLATEARVLGALDGRAAPRLLASGADGLGPWLVMEHLPLPSLASHETLAPARRAAIVACVAGGAFQALAEVHEAADAAGALGVVHGDVSPENILALDDGTATCFVDLGLATFRDTAPRRPGPFRGTLLYAAPEVARGEPCTVRSDLFSLSLSLLHVAHPELPARPRAALEPAALLVEAAEQPVTAFAEAAAAGLPPEVREALLAAVSFSSEARPASAREAWRHGSW